jgi:hypothetical protein
MDLAEQHQGHPLFAQMNELRQILEGTPRMLDDKEHLGLQAADMLAWPLRLRNQPQFNESPFAWLYEAIRGTVWPGCYGFGKQNWDARRSSDPQFQKYLKELRDLTDPPLI